MKFRARVIAAADFEFDFDVPEHQITESENPERPVQVVENEEEVLAARASAAKLALELARERFPDAEVSVEEVEEA